MKAGIALVAAREPVRIDQIAVETVAVRVSTRP
jgi:hypothetical protein